MLNRFTSIVLALVFVGSVTAGTRQALGTHVCPMAGIEMVDGMGKLPSCNREQGEAAIADSGDLGLCCFTIPTAPGSTETRFGLSPHSFSSAAVHPTIVQFPLAMLRLYECRDFTGVFIPNFQASYLRNLSFLI
jgi:hypothetical protein